MFKRLVHLFRGLSGRAVDPTLQHIHRTEVEFALVLVQAGTDPQLEWTLHAITQEAAQFGGVILQIMGPVILLAFSGVAGCQEAGQRQAFADHLAQRYRIFIRMVHGRRSALVGIFGGTRHRAYTVVLDHHPALLATLSALSPGEVVEA